MYLSIYLSIYLYNYLSIYLSGARRPSSPRQASERKPGSPVPACVACAPVCLDNSVIEYTSER